ncbi:MAG TPA: hypothetical protein PKN62_01970, partial [bacterium]|nr:hypothetical protein [bacterium]
MKFIKNTTWPEIFKNWRIREADNSSWVECATKIKGWPDWESWRSFTAQQIKATKHDWKIYQFENPLEEIPNILIGPYSSWQSSTTNENKITFQELLSIPIQYEKWSNHPGII